MANFGLANNVSDQSSYQLEARDKNGSVVEVDWSVSNGTNATVSPGRGSSTTVTTSSQEWTKITAKAVSGRDSGSTELFVSTRLPSDPGPRGEQAYIRKNKTNVRRGVTGSSAYSESKTLDANQRFIVHGELGSFIWGRPIFTDGVIPSTSHANFYFVAKSDIYYTQAQEIPVNGTMQSKVETAINAYPNWGGMTDANRRTALTALLRQAESILGLSQQNIVFLNLGSSPDGITMGIYFTTAGSVETTTGTVQVAAKTVVINSHTDAIGNANIRRTVFHEARHAYQSEVRASLGKHVASDTTYGFWANSYVRTVKEHGWVAYLSSPKEWDSRQLAGQGHLHNGTAVTPVYSGNWFS